MSDAVANCLPSYERPATVAVGFESDPHEIVGGSFAERDASLAFPMLHGLGNHLLVFVTNSCPARVITQSVNWFVALTAVEDVRHDAAWPPEFLLGSTFAAIDEIAEQFLWYDDVALNDRIAVRSESWIGFVC